MFDEVHFFCKQDDDWDIGIGHQLLMQCGVKQHIHDNAASLRDHPYGSPIIFDLCLDLFNRSKQWDSGDIWEDGEIWEFLQTVKPIVQAAALVTVSLSFEYSGTADDTRRLAKMILPVLIDWRKS